MTSAHLCSSTASLDLHRRVLSHSRSNSKPLVFSLVALGLRFGGEPPEICSKTSATRALRGRQAGAMGTVAPLRAAVAAPQTANIAPHATRTCPEAPV